MKKALLRLPFPPRKEFFYAFLTILFSSLMGCYLGEAFLRCFYLIPSLVSSYDPMGPTIAGAKLEIKQRDFHIHANFNRQGFRDEEFPEGKKPQEKRILFLGDSFAEGFGVEVEDRFSNRLVRALNAEAKGGTAYKAINAAQLATNPISYFENLVRFGIALQPDLVVVSVFLGNDFMGGRSALIRKDYSINEQKKTWLPVDGNSKLIGFLKLKYVTTLLRKGLSRIRRFRKFVVESPSGIFIPLKTDRFWDAYYKTSVNRNFFLEKGQVTDAEFNALTSKMNKGLVNASLIGELNPSYLLNALDAQKKINEGTKEKNFYNEADFTNTIKILEEIKSILDQHHVPSLVLLFPDIYEVYPEIYGAYLNNEWLFPTVPNSLRELGKIHQRTVGELKNKHFAFVDLTTPLKNAGGFTYHLNDGHLNELGQRIVSDELLRWTRARDW